MILKKNRVGDKKGLIKLFLILGMIGFITFPTLAQKATLSLGETTEKSLNMPWKEMITVGRAHDLLRDDLIDHLKIAQEKIGYKYIRFHATFDDDMEVVRRLENGDLYFQWHQVDKVYDNLLKLGFTPFVEINPMPKELASGEQTMFSYQMNVTPPKKYEEYEQMVKAFVQHMIEQHGRAEVASWYFEVWNEPNLGAFFSGTQAEYFQLYEACAKAVKSFGEEFRIGGPATSSGKWVADFINHCYENNVPADFLSTHYYPQDEMVEYPEGNSPYIPGNYFLDNVRKVKETVANSPMPELEIHWTEWNTLSSPSNEKISWSSNEYVDRLYAASFIVRNCLMLDTAAHTMGYWVISDIFNESKFRHQPFNHHYGMLNIYGMPKASFNGFLLLKKLKGNIVETKLKGDVPAACGSFATKDYETHRIVAWNHLPVYTPKRDAWTVTVELPDTDGKIVTQTTIKAGAGSAWESWKLMGSPVNLTETQYQLLDAHSKPDYKILTPTTIENGKVTVSLRSNEVVMFEVSPLINASGEGLELDDEMLEWEQGMNEERNGKGKE